MSTKDHPKAIIQGIADSLLGACEDLRLVDKYDLYQHLMTYWAETMQDDAYVITVDGWDAGKQIARRQREAQGKKRDVQGLGGLEGRLIPVSLLIEAYLAKEQGHLDELNAKLEHLDAQMEELKDEHSGEEGLLAEVIENDRISKGNVQRRMKEIRGDTAFADELAILQKYAALFEDEAETKGEVREAEKELERKVLAKYPALSLEEVKTLVVERKWMGALTEAVRREVDRLSQVLAARVKELAVRYAEPLSATMKNVEGLSAKFDAHLKKMGFVW